MTDPAQTALFVVIIVLAILLVALGIQVFFILRELRQTVSKTNKVLDDTGVITESVSKPLSSLSTLAMGIKTGATVANFLKRAKDSSKKK
jgi:uncharacterized protein YoxC